MFKLSRSHVKYILFIMIMCLFPTFSVKAQQPNTCEAFVDAVVSSVSNNCANTRPGEACFGFPEASLMLAGEEEPLVNFPDLIEIDNALSVTTSEYNPQLDQWGVVYIQGTANLSASLANRHSFLYFIVGDTQVNNEVPEDEALILPDTPVRVRTNTTASLYSFPPGFSDRVSEVIWSVPTGTELFTDGVDVDGWVRVAVIYRDTPVSRRSSAWLPANLLEANTELETLPIINQDSLTPFQSFTMLASDTPPVCSDLPMSEILVQSPGNVEGEIFVNGLRLRILSSVILRFSDTNAQGTNLRIIPLVGHAFLPNPNVLDGFEDGILIPAANYIDIPLVWDQVNAKYLLSPEFYARFVDFKQAYDEARSRGEWLINRNILIRLIFWGRISENILNYVIDVLEIRIPSGVGRVNPIIEGGVKPPLNLSGLGIPVVPE